MICIISVMLIKLNYSGMINVLKDIVTIELQIVRLQFRISKNSNDRRYHLFWINYLRLLLRDHSDRCAMSCRTQLLGNEKISNFAIVDICYSEFRALSENVWVISRKIENRVKFRFLLYFHFWLREFKVR